MSNGGAAAATYILMKKKSSKWMLTYGFSILVYEFL
jgi:hypothetical protein